MALAAAGLLNAGATAAAARPVIHVVPAGTIPPAAAIGLYVPGAGGSVSRESAIESLRRGKVENALLGGKPDGKVLADVEPADGDAGKPAVFVVLPPPGKQSNTKRYEIGIVADGYRGILTSDATRIRGLVPIADIAPTLVALQNGEPPPIKSEADADAPSDLRTLDNRLREIHRDRGWVLASVVLALVLLVIVRPPAAVIGGAAAMTASLLLSWVGATRFWVLIVAMVALTIGLAVLGSMRRDLIPFLVAGFFAGYLLVLALSPETNSLAVLGARPDGGGRFYGMTNQVETLLLPPLLAAAAIGGLGWPPARRPEQRRLERRRLGVPRRGVLRAPGLLGRRPARVRDSAGGALVPVARPRRDAQAGRDRRGRRRCARARLRRRRRGARRVEPCHARSRPSAPSSSSHPTALKLAAGASF